MSRAPSPEPARGGAALAIDARGLGLTHRGRPVFAGLDLRVPAGALLVIRGAAGSGKTALLLTLAGRMRFQHGTLHIAGHRLPAQARAVRHRVALGTVTGVNDLDDALTVEQHIAERLVIHQPWFKPVVRRRTVQQVIDRVDAVIDATAGRVTAAHAPAAQTPAGRALAGRGRDAGPAGAVTPAAGLGPLHRDRLVADVGPLDRMVLGVVLALLGRPEVLVVDDVDLLRDGTDRRRAWAGLAALDDDLTIVATCQEASELYELTGERDTGDGVAPSTTTLAGRPVLLLDLAGDGAAPALPGEPDDERATGVPDPVEGA